MKIENSSIVHDVCIVNIIFLSFHFLVRTNAEPNEYTLLPGLNKIIFRTLVLSCIPYRYKCTKYLFLCTEWSSLRKFLPNKW